MKYLFQEEELSLIRKIEKCDKEAWGRLYEHFFTAITGFIAGRIGDIHKAQDIAHNTFITALEEIKRGKYNPEYRFYTFLRKIAQREIKKEKANRSKGKETLFAELAAESNDEQGEASIYNGPPVPSDEKIIFTKEMVGSLFWLVCNCCAKPHQILCFLFINFLLWKPSELAEEKASSTLKEMETKFISACVAYFQGYATPEEIRQHLKRLIKKLNSRVGDIYQEAEYREMIKGRSDELVGSLKLKDFFRGRDPAVSISDWCNRVKNRAKKLAQDGILNK